MICWILKIASMVFCLLMPQANWSPFGKGIVSHASDFPVTMLIFRALHPRAVLPVLGTWPAHPSQVHTLLVPVLSTQSRLRNSIADSANYSIPFPMSQRPLPLLPPRPVLAGSGAAGEPCSLFHWCYHLISSVPAGSCSQAPLPDSEVRLCHQMDHSFIKYFSFKVLNPLQASADQIAIISQNYLTHKRLPELLMYSISLLLPRSHCNRRPIY